MPAERSRALFSLFFHKLSASQLAFAAEILDLCVVGPAKNIESIRCFSLFLVPPYLKEIDPVRDLTGLPF